MTRDKNKSITEEKDRLAYKLLEAYGDRAIHLFEHITGRKDLKTGNIMCLSFISGILGRK